MDSTTTATPSLTADVRRWVLSGCRWKNNAYYSDPLESLTKGNKLLSCQYVFTDVLDCVFARGVYKQLRPVGRYKQSHSDASFSRNIYSPVSLSSENIPLQITNKYASNATGIALARKEWEYEKISRGYVIPSPEQNKYQELSGEIATPTKDEFSSSQSTIEQQDVDVNFMTRECAFSFIQIWLSQIIHDSDLQSEKIALGLLHRVAKLPRNIHDNDSYILSIRNLIHIPVHTSSTATAEAVLKNLFILLITRDLVQDLRYNWGCKDLHRLRLPIRYTIADGKVWENVFFPVIIASVPYLNFSRGALAGIVALAEVLAYHVIEPSHQLATTLCTELVKRINTHSLGYETALRATRAALTRWAFEQNKSHFKAESATEVKAYDHGIDEPKEIVLPLLVRMRSSLLSEAPQFSLLPTILSVSSQSKSNQTESRKRSRTEDYDDDEELSDEDEDDEYSHAKKACRQLEDRARGGSANDNECDRGDILFSPEAMQKASEDAHAVTSTPVGAMSILDKVEVLNECIAIIERVLKKRKDDVGNCKEKLSRDTGGTDDGDSHDEYVDMVTGILQDLQSLDLAGNLSSKDVVAAAMEKACTNLTTLELTSKGSPRN
jgi:hypothetical protein